MIYIVDKNVNGCSCTEIEHLSPVKTPWHSPLYHTLPSIFVSWQNHRWLYVVFLPCFVSVWTFRLNPTSLLSRNC